MVLVETTRLKQHVTKISVLTTQTRFQYEMAEQKARLDQQPAWILCTVRLKRL